jgi:hypothetical protein
MLLLNKEHEMILKINYFVPKTSKIILLIEEGKLDWNREKEMGKEGFDDR